MDSILISNPPKIYMSNVAAVEEGIEVLGAETKKHYQFTRGWH